jgi:hypothetical protein
MKTNIVNANEVLSKELNNLDQYFSKNVSIETVSEDKIMVCNRCLALVMYNDRVAHLCYHYITNQERNCP